MFLVSVRHKLVEKSRKKGLRTNSEASALYDNFSWQICNFFYFSFHFFHVSNIGNGCNFRWQFVKRVIFRVVWKPTLSSLDQSKRLLLQFKDQKRRVANRFLHCHVVVGHPLVVGVDGCQVVLPQFRNENGCHWVFIFVYLHY